MKNKKTIFLVIFIVAVIIIKIFQIVFLNKVEKRLEYLEKSQNILVNEMHKNKDNITFISVYRRDNYAKTEKKIEKIEIPKTYYLDYDNYKKISILPNQHVYFEDALDNNIFIINNFLYIYKLSDFKNIKNDFFKIFQIFKVLYIVPTKYNNIDCYKIKTTEEEVYLERKTLNPIYLKFYGNKSNLKDNNLTTIEFEIKENVVSEEDVKIPDLSNYELINLEE